MGPLLFCGLATFGTVVAIGIIAAGTPRPAGPVAGMTTSRRLAFILFAFASGAGIWGVIVALLAAVTGEERSGASAHDLAATPLVAVLPILGAVVALGLMMAAFARLDPWIVGRSILFVVPQIGQAIVAAVVTVIIRGSATALAPLPFILLGLVAAGAVIGLGFAGQAAVAGLGPLDTLPPDDPAVRAALNRAVLRTVPFELAAIAAAAIAIVLVVTAR